MGPVVRQLRTKVDDEPIHYGIVKPSGHFRPDLDLVPRMGGDRARCLVGPWGRKLAASGARPAGATTAAATPATRSAPLAGATGMSKSDEVFDVIVIGGGGIRLRWPGG